MVGLRIDHLVLERELIWSYVYNINGLITGLGTCIPEHETDSPRHVMDDDEFIAFVTERKVWLFHQPPPPPPPPLLSLPVKIQKQVASRSGLDSERDLTPHMRP